MSKCGSERMGSVSLASMFANGCRSLGVPVTLVRTLSVSHAPINKHFNRHLVVNWRSRCSHSSALASQTYAVDTAHSTDSSVSSKGYPKYDRLLPCPPYNFPPRVEHLVVSEGGPVLEYICKALDLTHFHGFLLQIHSRFGFSF